MGTPRIVNGDERLAALTSTLEDIAQLGTKLILPDGRCFRMAQCDTSSALVNARLAQSPVPSTNFTDEEVDEMAVGARVMTDPGCSGADATVDQFRNGYFMVDEGAQLDPLHRIDTNTGIAATDADQVAIPNITLASPLQDAISDSETISYIQSPYRQIIEHLSAPTAMLVGVTVRAMATDVYAWVATQGPARVKQDGALIVGGGTSPSANIDGAVIAWIPELPTDVNATYIGTALFTNPTTTSKAIVYLRIDSN